MAIASNYLKYPEAMALQMALDLAPSAIKYAMKVVRHQVKRYWADVKAVWHQTREFVEKTRLAIVTLFHNMA